MLPSRVHGAGDIADIVRLIHACPLCKAGYEEAGITIIEKGDAAVVAHAVCPSCGQALLALVAVSGVGMSSVASRTDCTADDAVRFLNRASLTEDDILTMYAGMYKNDVQFSTLMYSHHL